MKEHTCHLAGIGDHHLCRVGLQRSLIPDLSAGFGVEWRLVTDDRDAFACLSRGNAGTVLDDGQNLSLGTLGVVSEKLGRPVLFGNIEPDRRICGFTRAGPGSTCALFLRHHSAVETGHIHG